MFGLGQQAAQATPALEQAQLASIQSQLGTAFTPTQQMISTYQPAGQAAGLAQSGRASGAQVYGAMAPGLLQAIQKTGETEAGLEQAQVNAILAGLGLENPAQANLEDSLMGKLTDKINEALGIG